MKSKTDVMEKLQKEIADIKEEIFPFKDTSSFKKLYLKLSEKLGHIEKGNNRGQEGSCYVIDFD